MMQSYYKYRNLQKEEEEEEEEEEEPQQKQQPRSSRSSQGSALGSGFDSADQLSTPPSQLSRNSVFVAKQAEESVSGQGKSTQQKGDERKLYKRRR
jgi:hypothetical protein